MPFVFWYSRLQPGVTAEAYEEWVRTVDYPGAADIESIIIYRVHRVLGAFEGEPLAGSRTVISDSRLASFSGGGAVSTVTGTLCSPSRAVPAATMCSR